MATSTGNNILARSRTIASQTATDANQSNVIDSLGGLRATLNHAIRETYRSHANDQKFTRDIVTKTAIAIASGVGACPDSIMRETLDGMGQFTDDNGSLITYYTYNIDASSGVNFQQLGYVCLDGDTIKYTAPSPTLDTYTGNLFVLAPTFPTLPASMASAITFPSAAIIDDVVLTLALAIGGNIKYAVA